MKWLIIILVIWIIGMFVAYKKYISKWDNSMFEKIWFSILWPVLLPLYGIWYLHNKN